MEAREEEGSVPRKKDPCLPQPPRVKRRKATPLRPPSRTAPTAAHPRAPSPDALYTSPAAGANARTTAACDARSITGKWAGIKNAA